MMGTGKSTVARALADVMGRYIFLDTDTIIEDLLGASVGEVFAKDGEEAFRSVESQVLDQVIRSWGGRGLRRGWSNFFVACAARVVSTFRSCMRRSAVLWRAKFVACFLRRMIDTKQQLKGERVERAQLACGVACQAVAIPSEVLVRGKT